MDNKKRSLFQRLITSFVIIFSLAFCIVTYAPIENWDFVNFFLNKTGTHIAKFYYTSGVAVDSSGNIFVADVGNHAIRKISPDGKVTTFVGKLGSNGYADGVGSEARFQAPAGIAISATGNIYVADQGNSIIRKISPTGVVTTIAGLAGERGTTDGVGSAARFSYPTGVAVDSLENVYVADSGNNLLRKITPDGMVKFINSESLLVPGDDPRLGNYNVPKGVAVDSQGFVYVADSNNQTIRKVTPHGNLLTLAGHFAEKGSVDTAIADNARFRAPSGIAVDSAGNVFIADTSNHTIRKITPKGEVSTLAGQPGVIGSADGPSQLATFNNPLGVAVDSKGNVYVADTSNSTIRKIDIASGMVSTVAGIAGKRGRSDSNFSR